MNQPIRQAQGEKGFAFIVLIGIIAVLILAGAGGFLALQEKKIPFFEKIVQQDISSEDATSPIALGDLCAGREERISFCLNSRGRCEKYCKGNKNELCRIIFPPNENRSIRGAGVHEQRRELLSLLYSDGNSKKKYTSKNLLDLWKSGGDFSAD